MSEINWLPELVLLETYSGDWNKYLTDLYKYYKEDFIDTKPVFNGAAVSVKRYPLEREKEATFWHIIQERVDEESPNIRRCERIRWPKPVIEHSSLGEIKIWQNKRKNEKRICIWYEQIEYLIVLAKRTGYILFWTAYPVTRGHTKNKLAKEYEAYKKADAAC